MAVDASVANLENVLNDVLDFEDENIAVSYSRCRRTDPCDYTSEVNRSSDDDGELKSDADSNLAGNNSSEEGEVQSEIDELEVTTEQSLVAGETPWERGLRLARERIEKVRTLRATEKNIAEKRMTLSVIAPTVDIEPERTSGEDVAWLCYYEPSIIGRTELTSPRFLLEDLLPPAATNLAEWRLGLSNGDRRRRSRRFRRDTSLSTSSSRSSSRDSSLGSRSVASSLISVASSWKATCALAMKDYLSSPIRNKDRRGGRNLSSSASSRLDSDSGSSDSISGSYHSKKLVTRMSDYLDSHPLRASKSGSRDGNCRWSDRLGRSQSESEQSSASGSDSQSSDSSYPQQRDYSNWKYVPRKAVDNERQESSYYSDSRSPTAVVDRLRSDVPPLPNERPIKRPWVVAPGVLGGSVADNLTKNTIANSPDQSHPSSRSCSPAPEEKRFITSWSRSPSSGENETQKQRPIRHECLPDVVPGDQTTRPRRAVTPSRRQRVHGHFDSQATDIQPVETVSSTDEFYRHPRSAKVTMGNSDEIFSLQDSVSQNISEPTQELASVQPPTSAGGELPLNRPGVRLTLAPRLKASAVDMTNIPGGVTRPSGSRINQPSPPRLPRLPFPVPSLGPRGHSPVTPSHLACTIDQSEIRRQAEAAAAIVEARERRRAAAEAARRRKNPVKKKRDDLSKIPVRGRPTYRRLSFSDSSNGSDSSASRSGSQSRSPSGTPEPNIIIETNYATPQAAPRNHKRRKVEVAVPHPSAYDGMPEMVAAYARQLPRGMFNEGPQNFEHKRYHVKVGSDCLPKYRSEQGVIEDILFKVPDSSYPKGTHNDYGMDNDATGHPAMSRRRESRGGTANTSRYEEQMMRYEHSNVRHGDIRRTTTVPIYDSGPVQRTSRPRTPHADMPFSESVGPRSPHTVMVSRPHRGDRKRVVEPTASGAYNIPKPSRKRAVIVEPEIQSISNTEFTRARSRHRSRGPGAPIDRSEPFESDSTAAEQRLRELRERLNLVDDAIAEIKAGNNSGYFNARY